MKILCFEITYVGFGKEAAIRKYAERQLKSGIHWIDVIKNIRSNFNLPLLKAKEAFVESVKKDQTLLEYIPEDRRQQYRRTA